MERSRPISAFIQMPGNTNESQKIAKTRCYKTAITFFFARKNQKENREDKMKVTDVLVSCLENEGVKFVFGIIGTETIDLANSLSKSAQIQFVNVRHEQGAAFMADIYGRLSKKAGVCLSTLGPGATNLITGISSAQLDHSPVVALIGQADVDRHHKESHQYVDLVKIFEPITKWCTEIRESETVPDSIGRSI